MDAENSNDQSSAGGSARLFEGLLALLLFALLAVTVLWHLGILQVEPTGVRFALVGLLVFLLPGMLVARCGFYRSIIDGLDLIPLGFCTSVALVAPVLFLGYVLELPLVLLLRLCLGIYAAALVVCIFAIARRKKGRRPAHPPEVRLNFAALFVLIILSTVLSALAWRMNHSAMGGEDLFHHLGRVRKLAEHPRVSPLANAFIHAEKPDVGYGYNCWHLLLAGVARLANVDVILAYLWLSAALVPVKLLATFCFTRLLLKDRRPALLATIFLGLYYGIYHAGGFWLRIGYPGAVGWLIIMPMVLLLGFSYLRGSGKAALVGGAWLAMTLAVVHKLFFLLLGLSLISFAILTLFIRWDQKWAFVRIVLFGVLAALLSAAPLAWEYFHCSLTSAAALRIASRGTINLGGGKFIMPPEVMTASTFAVAAAIVLAPLLLFQVRRNFWSIFLIASIIPPFVMMTNPWLTPTLAQKILFAARKIGLMLPTFPILGYFGHLLVQKVTLPETTVVTRPRLRYSLGALALTLGFLVPCLYSNTAHMGKLAGYLLGWARYDLRQPPPVVNLIKAHAPEQAVVFSDWRTSFIIPAFTNHYVCSWATGQAGTGAPTGEHRQQAAKVVFNPEADIKHKLALLKQYGAGYIIFNGEASSWLGLGWPTGLENYPDVFVRLADVLVPASGFPPPGQVEQAAVTRAKTSAHQRYHVAIYKVNYPERADNISREPVGS